MEHFCISWHMAVADRSDHSVAGQELRWTSFRVNQRCNSYRLQVLGPPLWLTGSQDVSGDVFSHAGLDTPNDPDWERMGSCWVTASAKCRARTNGGIYGVTNICKSQSCGSRPCSYNLTSWFSLWLEIISCSCKFWLKRQNLLVLVTIYWHHYIAQICKYITTLLAKHIVEVYHASSGVLFCRVPLCVLLPYT